ncbi:MAG: methionine--tRNA ligase [Pseudomonadota bacterium]
MRCYYTTPIYYVNAEPHLGHAYTTVVADALSRFCRLKGEEAFFLTGTDEHGDKVVQAATKAGVSPQEYSDRISGLYRDLWPRLAVAPSRFIRTSQAEHQRVVQAVLQKVHEAGDIYFSEYGGLYCYGCERFYLERELVDGKCPDHLVEPTFIKEANYFFRMSRYQDWLLEHIGAHPDFIRPERYRNEVLSFLSEPLEDLCISRPKSRLEWGIELPFDNRFVTYVWFDALLNYVSGLDWPDGELFARYWPVAQHLVAKDILKPHAIYWPTMLKAAGIEPFQHLNVHGYWNIAETKMSKSIGNIIRPQEVAARYGVDALRYFLLREMVFGLDSSFSEEALVGRLNSELANDLGNLYSRVLAMVRKYFQGIVPALPEPLQPWEADLKAGCLDTMETYIDHFEAFAFHKALMALWDFVNAVNRYIDQNAPWALAKQATESQDARLRLESVMAASCGALASIAICISPVMPQTGEAMLRGLELPAAEGGPLLAEAEDWRRLAGHTVRQVPPLFPRVEPPSAAPESEETTMEQAGLIDIEDFQKVELRVAEVVAAEAVPKSSKLLKLTVASPEERTVVAGIAKDYAPAQLVGRKVVLVANLKPHKLMGVTSEGMLLAAKSEEGKLALLTLDRPVQAGARIR